VSAAPEIAVVVASHDRPIRLRWLLNALEEQTLERERFEVVVAHDSAGEETERLLRAHPLARAGVLRHISFAPGPGPAAKRNAAWRAARAPVVLFTDDDCRPPADWLERALAAVRAHPEAIVQGATEPDPDELMLLERAPHARTQRIEPPNRWGETCNIAYPRAVLERVGGFDEALPVAAGEDTDLLQRALAAGGRSVGAPAVVTYHAVEVEPLVVRVRALWRWQHTAYVIKRHPSLRRGFPLGVFWKVRHAKLALALAGAPLARRRPLLAAALSVPYARHVLPSYGRTPRGLARAVSELPGRAAADAVEMAAVARGSLRYRTLVL
jgi:GT2 family glycosyltransferase